MKTYLSHILIVFTTLAILFSAVSAQDDKTRSITSDDFNSQRPAASKSSKKGSRKQARRASYKYVAKQARVVRRKSGAPAKKAPDTQPVKVTEIGVTIWRMRQPWRGENGPKLPVKINESIVMWTPERVGLDTVFKKGDRVRIAIESSISGYLYVVNSEMYSTGGFGKPLLIFPAGGEDNSVEPGMMVDIPDKADDLPYFLINPQGRDYSGELLTIILSPKALANIRIDKEGGIKDLDDLGEYEEDADVEVYTRKDKNDTVYTAAEKEAGCGAKTRELVREKMPDKPCGTASRQLTREEPLPQSIYRVKSAAGRPTVAFIRLNVL